MTVLAWVIVGVTVWAVLSFPAALLAGRWMRQNGGSD